MKERYEKYREIIVYLITGVLTTILNWACYGLGVSVFHWPVFVSNLIAWIAAVIFAYVTNKLIVFGSHCDSFGEVLIECAKFVSARLLTMVIEVGGVYLFVNIIGQAAMIGKLETQVIVIIVNYFISKFFVFK